MEVGDTIDGKFASYQVTSPLGKGGRGSAFLAVVKSVKASAAAQSLFESMPVVIKVPPPLGNNYSAKQKRAFLRRVNEALRAEYRLLNRLKGVASAAHVYDLSATDVLVGDDPEPCFALVSQFIPGPSLRAWRATHAESLREATFFFKWAGLLARAIGQMHRAGVVHGDIWADNVIIRDESEPVIIDFGASAIRTAMPEDRELDPSHPYMPPERERSVEADMYSLGGTMYFLATGQDPPRPDRHSGRVRAQVVAGLKNENRQLYKECSGIANVVARCLRPLGDPTLARTANAEQLVEDLELFDPAAVEAVKDLRGLVDLVGGMTAKLDLTEPLFARLVAGRLRQLEHDIGEMLHQVHDVQGDHEHLVMVLSNFLSVCEEGDLYLTASVPWLWYAKNIGVRGRFLAVNKTAVKRGATIRRVFVVTKSELQEDSALDVLRAHAELLSEIDEEQQAVGESGSDVQSRPINTIDPQIKAGGLFTGVLLVDDEERRRLFEQLPHCGIWIRDSRSKVVIPRYDENSRRLTGFRLLPGDGSPHAQVSLFERTFVKQSLEEIRTFLSRLGPPA